MLDTHTHHYLCPAIHGLLSGGVSKRNRKEDSTRILTVKLNAAPNTWRSSKHDLSFGHSCSLPSASCCLHTHTHTQHREKESGCRRLSVQQQGGAEGGSPLRRRTETAHTGPPPWCWRRSHSPSYAFCRPSWPHSSLLP
jgi:hypothetical protein